MAATTETVKPDTKPLKVKLLQLHTHAGVEHQPGEVIALDADQAAWLINLGGAEAANA